MFTAAPVRVLHLIDALAPGGVARWLYDIVRLADPRAVEQRIFSLYPEHRGLFPYADELRRLGAYRQPASPAVLRRLFDFRRRLSQSPALAPLSVLAMAPLLAGYAGIVLHQLPRLVQQFRPEVLHAHGTYGLLLGILLRRLLRIPLVHTVPCLHSQFLEEGYRWMPPLYRSSHRYVEKFFTGMPADAQAMGLPAAKLQAITGVIDFTVTEPYHQARSQWRPEIRRRLGVPEDAILLLSVGRLIPSKGHEYAAEAVARLPRAHWALLGDGPQAEELTALVQRLGLAARAHLLGFQPDPLPYYAAADVYLRTPLLESENLCSYQAMALGLPVAGFQAAQETELLATVGHGLLVPPRDSTALATALESILAAPDRGQSLGARGLAYARAHLDMADTIGEFVACYGEVSRRG